MRLSEFDIKQLRTFIAVVECGGFTAAEDMLNVSQSTISTSIAQLERRLGYRLCEQGRAGFTLTSRGEALYKRALTLAEAVAEFEDAARGLKGVLSGSLRLAIIDNIISDPRCPVVDALAALKNGPRISIEILPPSEIENAIAAGRVDLGVSIIEQRLPTLQYQPLYLENDYLYCGAANPMLQLSDPEALRDSVQSAPKVVRSFLNLQDFSPLSDQEETIHAAVTNLEAAAALVLAGTHIGFMPDHFAARWVETGAMRPLLPSEYRRTSEIAVMSPLKRESPPVVAHFLEQLIRAARAEATDDETRQALPA